MRLFCIAGEPTQKWKKVEKEKLCEYLSKLVMNYT